MLELESSEVIIKVLKRLLKVISSTDYNHNKEQIFTLSRFKGIET